MEVNTVYGILYEVKAKAIIEALVKRQAKGRWMVKLYATHLPKWTARRTA